MSKYCYTIKQIINYKIELTTKNVSHKDCKVKKYSGFGLTRMFYLSFD